MSTQWKTKPRWAKDDRSNFLDLVLGPSKKLNGTPIKISRVKVKPPSLAYSPRSRDEFTASPYDLSEIGRAQDTESIIRRSVAKHVTLCLKEGWDIIGKDPATVEYIKRRLFEFEMASLISFDQIVRDIVQNVVTYANSFLAFKRDTSISSGRPITKFGRPLEPIAGIFTADPSSMRVRRNKFGEIKEWRQEIELVI